mgnify:CR=1 FL=1
MTGKKIYWNSFLMIHPYLPDSLRKIVANEINKSGEYRKDPIRGLFYSKIFYKQSYNLFILKISLRNKHAFLNSHFNLKNFLSLFIQQSLIKLVCSIANQVFIMWIKDK